MKQQSIPKTLLGKVLDFNTGYADFQMDYYISVRSGKTPYGVFKQACKEFESRYYNLFELHCDLEQTKRKLEEEKDYVEKIRMRARIEGRGKQIKRCEQEAARFLSQSSYLDSKYNYGSLSHQEREKLEVEMWVQDIKEQIANDLWNTSVQTKEGLVPGRVSKSVRGLVMNCPDVIREQVNDYMYLHNKKAELMEWIRERKNYQLPEALPSVEFKETKLLDFIKEVNHAVDTRKL